MKLFALIPVSVGMMALAGLGAAAWSKDGPVAFIDQGAAWTAPLRAAFYAQDQGSRLIPLAWLKALLQPDGTPFLAGSLTRYGYLATEPATELPIGFTVADAPTGPTVGLTCAACHTRQIIVADRSYRIDGGPAFADFGAFIEDLDGAVRRVLADDAAFARFAKSVGGTSFNAEGLADLHAEVSLWSLRFHALIGGSISHERPWGPARVDAIGMIFNHLTGLDLGQAPTYLIPENIVVADAPARYPFLWNAHLQDFTQWSGFAANGNDGLALARNLGEVFGVFAVFHPDSKSNATPLDRDYLASNSANIAGLEAAEVESGRLGAPVWPFQRDVALAARGKAVFDRPTAEGGCIECHGVRTGEQRSASATTWKTTLRDVGTDSRQWAILLRSAKTGTLEGASVPGVAAPLGQADLSLSILKTAVTGSLVQLQAAMQPDRPAKAQPAAMAASPMSMTDLTMTMHVEGMAAKAAAMTSGAPRPGTSPYEARVLRGIWAAAPYLHNGSVPTLHDLLLPAQQRRRTFAVGPVYDIETVGLAATQQNASFVLKTTGCEDRASGDSNCGHDYGTSLPPDDKRALLEYLKTL